MVSAVRFCPPPPDAQAPQPDGLVLVTNERAELISLQLDEIEAPQHPVVEARRGGRGPLEPSGDGATGMPRDSGGPGKAHAFDAQARDLLELPSRAAKTAVRGPRVCADGAPADRASVPLPSAGLCRKRAVAHDVQARLSTVGAPWPSGRTKLQISAGCGKIINSPPTGAASGRRAR